jgi:hypothetical protein
MSPDIRTTNHYTIENELRDKSNDYIIKDDSEKRNTILNA